MGARVTRSDRIRAARSRLAPKPSPVTVLLVSPMAYADVLRWHARAWAGRTSEFDDPETWRAEELVHANTYAADCARRWGELCRSRVKGAA